MDLSFDTETLEKIFSLGNMSAGIAWLILILAPRRWPMINAIPALIIPLLLAVAYCVMLAGGISAGNDGSFSSLAGVRQLFSFDVTLLAGWLHYLAFDLLVGVMIARKADEIGLHRIFQAPILLMTFMFGPAGFLVFQLTRGGMSLLGANKGN